MRMLIVLACLLVASCGGTPLYAAPACKIATRDEAIAQAKIIAATSGARVGLLSVPITAQTTADAIFDAAGEPHREVVELVLVLLPDGAVLIGLIGLDGCQSATVRTNAAALAAILGRGA